MIYKNQTESNYHASTSSNKLVRIKNQRAFYQASDFVSSLFASDFLGDDITWSGIDYTEVEVYRDSLGWQFPVVPGISGDGVDLTTPNKIIFTPDLNPGERVALVKRNSIQTTSAPEISGFSDFTEIAAASTTLTYKFSRPIPLTYHNGVNRGMHYSLTLDGKRLTPNTPGNTNFDYTENQITGTDTFNTITFNIIPSDPTLTLNLVLDSKGFYKSNDISVNELTSLRKDVNSYPLPIQIVESKILGPTTLGTTTIVVDDTTPQISEGNSVFTVVFTPKVSYSRIQIESLLHYATPTAAGSVTLQTLFLNGGANAVRTAAVFQNSATVGQIDQHKLIYSYSPGSISPITIHIRLGSSVAGTLYLNREQTVTRYNGTVESYLKITEYSS